MKQKAVFAPVMDLDSEMVALEALRSAGESVSTTLWSSALRYGIAVLVVVLAGVLTFLMPAITEGAPFLFFFAAVMLSAWYGGLGPALLTTFLAAVWNTFFVLPSLSALEPGAPLDALRLSFFLLVAILMSTLQARQRRATMTERLQREYWQTTLSSVGDAVIVTDAQGQILVMNPVAQHVTGWTLHEARGRALSDVFVIQQEETYQPVENPVTTVLRTGGVVGLANHTVLIRKDGSACPIDDSAAPIRDEQGRLFGIVLIFRDITARRQVEHALQASEEKYRGLFDAIDEGFCLIEKVESAGGEPVEFRYVETNPAFATQTGAHNVLGKTIGQVFPLEPQDWRETYDTVLRTGEPQRFARTLATHGRELELYAFRVEDGAGRRVAVLFKDVTAQKQAAENSLRLAALVEFSDDAIVSKTLDGIVTSWNAAAERIFGYRAEEMIGSSIRRLLPDERQAEEDLILARLRRGERIEHFETVRQTKDGRLLEVSVTVSPIQDAQGRIIGASKIARDITARKQADAAVRRSEQELADFFENATVGLHWVGPDGTILRVNRAELDLLGYTREEYLGRHIAEFHADQAVIADILRRLTRGETLQNYEARLRCKDGSIRHVVIDSSVLREQGRFVHTRCFTRDITARKQLEGQLAQRAAELEGLNAELQQFSYMVSHDLQEPLRTITSFGQLLEQRTGDTLEAEAREFLGFVVEGAQRMQQLITALLAYTRLGNIPEFQAVDCEGVLAQVLSALQARIAACAAVITQDPLPTVQGDALRLGQVFQNLIGNALKFCEAQPPRIHISAVPEGRNWRFAVRDNGIGLDPQHGARIFQVFQRLQARQAYEGTGMGLAICKKIVEQHGGRIWVESQPGQGATFFFTLPGMAPSGVDTIADQRAHLNRKLRF